MELAVMSVRPGAAMRFGYRSGDLHRPEVLIWSHRQRVLATVTDRAADGSLVLAVDDPSQLNAVAEGGRLLMAYRADRALLRRRRLAPLATTSYTVDHERGLIRARFADHADGMRWLPEPITACLFSDVLFLRRLTVTLVGMSPYVGRLLVDDPGRVLLPGMTATLTWWTPWLGEVRLLVQLTTVDREGVACFRMVDRASMVRAAIMLTGTVPDFTLDGLAAVGVRRSKVTKYLTVRTVADQTSFRTALEVRRLGNRKFGRLARVADAIDLADELDPYAIIFTCFLGEIPVGTGRVVVNDGHRDRSEIEYATDGLPERIWAGGFVEISRLAIHPDCNGGGVIVAIFREVARLALNLECRFVVLDAIEKLVPAYQRIGAKRLPLTKVHPYSKETVQVMAIDIGQVFSGLDRQLPYWQYVFGPVVRHHMRTSRPEALTSLFSSLGKVRFWLKRLLSRAF